MAKSLQKTVERAIDMEDIKQFPEFHVDHVQMPEIQTWPVNADSADTVQYTLKVGINMPRKSQTKEGTEAIIRLVDYEVIQEDNRGKKSRSLD